MQAGKLLSCISFFSVFFSIICKIWIIFNLYYFAGSTSLALENAATFLRSESDTVMAPARHDPTESMKQNVRHLLAAGIFVFICPWVRPIDLANELYRILWGSLALDSPSSSLRSFLGSKEAIPFYTKTDLVDPMAWRSCFLCFVAVYGHLEPEQMLMLYFNKHFVFDLMDSDAFRFSGWNWVFSVQEMDVLLAVKKGRVSLLAEPRIHLAFAGQDASGYPSGMTVSWFTRLAGTPMMIEMHAILHVPHRVFDSYSRTHIQACIEGASPRIAQQLSW